MRAYERNKGFEFSEDMQKIVRYLCENGTVYITEKTIEKLYRVFSEEEYCAGWMRVDEKRLDEFADWLDGKEI
jgi:hypothetical protein